MFWRSLALLAPFGTFFWHSLALLAPCLAPCFGTCYWTKRWLYNAVRLCTQIICGHTVNMERPRIVETPLGGQQLKLNGFVYYRRSNIQGKTYWKCSQKGRCNATAITRREGKRITVLKEGEHRHSPFVNDEPDHDMYDDSTDQGDNEDDDERNNDESSDQEDDELSSDTSDEEESSPEAEWETWVEDSEGEEVDDEEEVDVEEAGDEEEDDIDAYGLFRNNLKRYKIELRILQEGQPALRDAVIKSADKGLICLLCEICYNLLAGKMDLSKRIKNILRPFRDDVRLMASVNITWREKQENLEQNAQDPFIPVLLNVVWPLL